MRRPYLLLLALAVAGAAPDAPQATLRLQVLLDRAHFSPGEIDGEDGTNTRRALAAFQRERGLRSGASPDTATWEALGAGGAPPLLSYVLTTEDVSGPFEAIPDDMMEKARLPALTYTSALEAIAERFHASPQLLERLNPGVAWGRVGETVVVPNVGGSAVPKAETVVVDEEDLAVWTLDRDGKALTRYPASLGSEHDPLPLGQFEVKGISRNPTSRTTRISSGTPIPPTPRRSSRPARTAPWASSGSTSRSSTTASTEPPSPRPSARRSRTAASASRTGTRPSSPGSCAWALRSSCGPRGGEECPPLGGVRRDRPRSAAARPSDPRRPGPHGTRTAAGRRLGRRRRGAAPAYGRGTRRPALCERVLCSIRWRASPRTRCATPSRKAAPGTCTRPWTSSRHAARACWRSTTAA